VNFLAAFVGEMMSIAALVLLVVGVMKVFQLARELREVKGLLSEIKRNMQVQNVAAARPDPQEPISPEDFVRAVHSQSYEEAVMEPPVLPPHS
jgi:hypothetical protein